MKNSNKNGTFMLLGLSLGLMSGIGGSVYFMHHRPVKAQILINDAKNMMKDLK